MKRSLVSVGVWLGVLVAGCSHASGGETGPVGASVTANAASHAERPTMDGTCSVTEGESVQTFTYVRGRLTESTATELDFHTTYTYEGSRLAGIERVIRGTLAFRKELQYGASGRLDALITLTPQLDPTTLEESERRSFDYDAAGRALRMTNATPFGDTTQVCVVEYDEHERLASYTCEVPGLDEEPDRSTYHYDAAGRLSEVRSAFAIFRVHYDLSGFQEHVDALSETGEVRATEALIRDDAGRAVERRATTLLGRVLVATIAFEGAFGPGAECGAPPPPPPGIPEHGQSIWFDISP